MSNIDWSGKIQTEINGALSYFESIGVKPTLRTLFYNLVSKNIIGNTKSTYKGLSKWLVTARKNGLVRWDALEDTARHSYGSFHDDRFAEDIDETSASALDRKLEEFNAENIINDFFQYVADYATVSRWADQPTIAEIWIEKEALAKTIQQWTDAYGVKIRVNKGYSSWTFLYENCRELKGYLKSHEKIVVFYLGDMDPSGVDMERFLKEALEYFDLDPSRVELKRLSITLEQVRKYKLPPKPEDAETLAKLKRDPRTAAYQGKCIVELDAMVAFVPEEFKAIVIDAVKEVWNREIYDKLREEARVKNEIIQKKLDEIKEQAKERMKAL